MKNIKIIIAATVIAAVAIAILLSMGNKSPETGIVAHRGFWNCEEAGYAQNSIASLECAQEAGVWGSEFDVYMTADNHLVVVHDAVTQGYEIETTPYDTLRNNIILPNGERIPNIDEYLEQGKKCSSTVLVFEIKSHALSDERQDLIADLAVAKVKEYDLNPEEVIFIAFSYRICKRVAGLMPDYTVQYLSSDKHPSEVLADGINGIDYVGHSLTKNPTWVQEAKDLGMSTNVWTINDHEELKAFHEMGVDYITTDVPLEARKIFEENGLKEKVIK